MEMVQYDNESSQQSHSLLSLPLGLHTELARRAFSVGAPSTCNSLPADIRLWENILTFKRHLKTHLFKLSPPVLHQALLCLRT